jgi:hypothetical protein
MLLTAKELAKALDVHITTIRRAYRTKRIPYERFYKLYFFDLKKVRSAMRRDGLGLIAPRERGTAARPAKRPRSVRRGRSQQWASGRGCPHRSAGNPGALCTDSVQMLPPCSISSKSSPRCDVIMREFHPGRGEIISLGFHPPMFGVSSGYSATHRPAPPPRTRSAAGTRTAALIERHPYCQNS